MRKSTVLSRAIGLALAGSSINALNVAYAQEQEAAASDEVPAVVVTGSRIKQSTYTSSAPMDVIVPEAAAAQGVSGVSQLLQSTTVAAGSQQVTAATSTAFVQNGGIGTETLSLRGLGANRTLTLLNGRRAGPAGTRGGVSSFDLNVIPLSAIERIEVLKDGASSIYGSDAVAGVVNIITKKSTGVTLDAYTSQPALKGGAETRVSASWGQKFDRGSFRITGDYHKQSELTNGNRSYFRCGEEYIFDPTSGSRNDIQDPRTSRPHCTDLLWGQVWLYDYATDFGGDTNVPDAAFRLAQYDYDGNLGTFVPGYASNASDPNFLGTPSGWFPVLYDRPSEGAANADHPFQDASSVIPDIERDTVFGEGEFAISDTVTAYGEFLLNRRTTDVNSYRQYWTYMYTEDFLAFSGDAPAPGSGNPLAAGWTGAQWLSPTPITDHSDSGIDVTYTRFVAGLRGDFNADWNWDVSFQYSKSDGDYTDEQIFNDSIVDNQFSIGSCVGTFSSVRGAPCVDVPWLDPDFLRGNVSQPVRDFLFGVETGNTTYKQLSGEAYVSGPIAHLPAGPLGAAFGVHYQRDEINDTPGEITRAGNAWGSTSAGITKGKDKTKAIFAEVEVPLLAGRKGIEQLTLNASGRYTDVDSYGSGSTYKVGLNWQIVPWLRIRANQGTSFRSPALYELYLADQTSFLSQRNLDPCIQWQAALDAANISPTTAANCAADGLAPDFDGGSITATIITGGGFGRLKAETSTYKTIGFIWQPQFADLQLSVDYFDIDVNNEVDQLGAEQIVGGCYNSAFFPDDPLCDLFDRTGLNQGVDNLHDSFINIANQRNSGIDVSLTYSHPIGRGKLTLETEHTFQSTDTRALFASTQENLNGEMGEPRWVGHLNANYDIGSWKFFWGAEFIGSSSNYRHFGGNTTTLYGETVRVVLGSGVTTYHSLSVTRGFEKWGMTAILGVANVFDEEPPQVTTLGLGELDTHGKSAFYSQYDSTGRRFFLNLKKNF